MDTTTTTTSVRTHAEELASMIGHRFLQNSAINISNNNSTAESSDFLDYLHDHTFAFFGFVVGGIIVILIIYCVIREWLIHKYGYECCAPTGERGERAIMSRSRHLQYLDDQQLAIDLQTEIEQEDRKATLAKQRKGRRAKYEKFLVPYTMIVEDGDVCDAAALKEQNIVEKQSTMNISTDFDKKVDRSSPELMTVKEIDGGANDDVDLEAATIPSSHTISTPMSPKIDDENDNLEMERERVLQLPVKDDKGKLRHVDAECAICLLEYETGDNVVWSTRKVCKHAFHDECILVWLSKGKKRCPVCRHFFVPGSSIDDKKVITHDENDEEAYINGSTLDEDTESDEDPLAASVGTVDGDTTEAETLEEREESQRSASERILFRRLSREVLA